LRLTPELLRPLTRGEVQGFYDNSGGKSTIKQDELLKTVERQTKAVEREAAASMLFMLRVKG
jgi:hypothetical protein